MRFVGLLVLVRLIVGAVAAGQRGYFIHAPQSVYQRGHDRVDRDRRTTELCGRQSQSDEPHRAPTQFITPTAQFQPI
jgi:hypothetical protein